MSIHITVTVDEREWHRWWAWRPVTVEIERENGVIVTTRVWRQWIYRRVFSDYVGSSRYYSLTGEE